MRASCGKPAKDAGRSSSRRAASAASVAAEMTGKVTVAVSFWLITEL
jgi:hypothetical protein